MKVMGGPGAKPIKFWSDTLEDSCVKQANNMAQLPFLFRHVSLMPDAHSGYGMPIGGVLAAIGAVCPNAVGVDIGCGVMAMQTSMSLDQWNDLDSEQLMHSIHRGIPTGFNHHKEAQKGWVNEDVAREGFGYITGREFEKSLHSIGTLGGGNHFVEAQTDGEGIWFMIHSGSRNLGKQICDHYNKKAVQLNAAWHTKVDPAWELAFLPLNSIGADNYLRDMECALAFAKENRLRMSSVIYAELVRLGHKFDKTYDVHHNYAAMENHYGKNVLVHRKGAVRARSGEIVIIPGSMGANSYIAEGLGNRDSFMSCSHGAGRRMGRNAAKKDLAVQESLRRMTTVLHSSGSNVDEAPLAYKDIEMVMEQQADLVTPLIKLRPLATIKA